MSFVATNYPSSRMTRLILDNMPPIHRVLLCCCVWASLVAQADRGVSKLDATITDCTPSDGLVVLTGNDLAPLLDVPLERLSLLRASTRGLTPIAFQVDRRDEQGRYILENNEAYASGRTPLTRNDELVLRAADAGVRLRDASQPPATPTLVEIKINGSPDTLNEWVYASISGKPVQMTDNAHMVYDPATDTVSTASYQIGFNRRLPFLIDAFRWRQGNGSGWSPDVVDTMKIRHEGVFLGIVPFRRTQRDYQSRLLAVKPGPLRVIRRTENRVRMFWQLNTPAVYIDYIIMPGGFVMDTVIDIPFNVGLFFSDIETLTTVDWNYGSALPDLTVHAPGHPHALVIDGHMSEDEHDFNTSHSHRFGVASTLGTIGVDLQIPPGVPITPWLYLRDSQGEADPPEEQIGQFGNVGFRTTGWERIDTQVQHVRFAVCVRAQQENQLSPAFDSAP